MDLDYNFLDVGSIVGAAGIAAQVVALQPVVDGIEAVGVAEACGNGCE